MNPITISVVGLLILLLLFSQGVHIAFAFAIVGALGVVVLKGPAAALALLGNTPYDYATSSALLAIPLFILMGQFVYVSGISQELFNTAYKLAGRLHGGLALATNIAGTIFGACCGVSMAACATFGTIAYPEMIKHKYDPKLATGCIAAGGCLSDLIPPSNAFILFGVLTSTSIGALFIAGIVPGLVLSALNLVIIYIICKRNPQKGPPGESYSFKEVLRSSYSVLWVLALFVLVIGGLFAGIFTPTEAGSIGALGAFIIAIARRKLNYSGLASVLTNSITTTCFILTIIIGAMIFSKFLAICGLSAALGNWIETLTISRHIIMISILLLYVVLGMFMDVLSMILLTIPIVFPLVTSLGFDPVWFGVMLTLVGEMGLLTPPVGMNVFVVSGVTKVPVGDVFRGIVPFVGMIAICMVFMYIFPQISLFLPSIMR